MREMKDSGVAWIGEIPVQWGVVYLSSIVSERKHKNEGMKENNLLSLSYGNVVRKNINTSDGLLPANFEGYNIIELGDIVLRLTDLQNDHTSLRTGLCKEKGIITSAYVTLNVDNGIISSEYLHYLLHSFDCCKGFYGMGSGVRQGLNYDGIKKVEILMPDKSDQQKIATHLDRKCTQIDALISNAQQQIEKLKALRDAVLREVLSEGANITGICREQYTTTKMGSIGTYKKGPFGSSLKKSMFVPKGEKTFKVYEQKNAIYKNATLGYYYISEEKFNELKSFEICPGDIIISCAGTIGECYEIPVDAEKGVINQALMYVRLNKDMDTLFFTYLFEFVIKSISLTDSNGSAMKNIPPFDKIKPFIISIPSTKENQHKLAEYIQKKIKTITDLAEIKQKKIEKLQQYKKSLIYEYVTGKKEV